MTTPTTGLIRTAEQLRGRRVLIMGLGTKDGGLGAALYALDHGARVTVTDRQQAGRLDGSLRQLAGKPVRLRLGRHDEVDFAASEVVLRNPGIGREHPLLRLAAERGAIVDSPIGLFCEVMDRPYIGVTGTKGKSLTTHLVQRMLAAAGLVAVAAGNNCVSPLRHLDRRGVELVLELSSWQLGELGLHGRSPHVACWLDFFPDHLDHYRGDLEAYFEDKRMITAHQGPGDVIVLPWGDRRLRELPTRAQKHFFGERGVRIAGEAIVSPSSEEVARLDELSAALRVPHHLGLALAATACALARGVPTGAIREALRTFEGIPHRFERLLDRAGVVYINDSAATTPRSVALALEAAPRRPVALIFGGGGDKGQAYDALAPVASRLADRIYLFSDDGPSAKLARHLQGEVETVDRLAQAVERCERFLRRAGGGTLLLSPGCSGAPRYQDLFVRGELFRRLVRERCA
jgi:UDP-N-acetylmuramoylalanine--D-glutamate ligase